MKTALPYWIPTALFSLMLLGSGGASLAGVPEMVENFGRLGFDPWFVRWLGFFKIAGVVVLLAPGLPRLKEWAYAGFVINLTSAVAAHLAAGDGVGEIVAPILALGLLMTSWARRPASRTLAAPTGASTPLAAAPAK